MAPEIETTTDGYLAIWRYGKAYAARMVGGIEKGIEDLQEMCSGDRWESSPLIMDPTPDTQYAVALFHFDPVIDLYVEREGTEDMGTLCAIAFSVNLRATKKVLSEIALNCDVETESPTPETLMGSTFAIDASMQNLYPRISELAARKNIPFEKAHDVKHYELFLQTHLRLSKPERNRKVEEKFGIVLE